MSENIKIFQTYEAGEELKRLYKYLTGNLTNPAAIDGTSILGVHNALPVGTDIEKLAKTASYIDLVSRLLDDYFTAFAAYRSEKYVRTNQINEVKDAESKAAANPANDTPLKRATAALALLATSESFKASKALPANLLGVVNITAASLALPTELFDK